ncbi:MAG TPA: hypothetical protein V6C95_19745 [Coleofasciculaceae cyanobacterium]
MAYYQFIAPEYDNAVLDEAEFDLLADVEQAANYLADYHGCQVTTLRKLSSNSSKSLVERLQETLLKWRLA